MWRNAYNMLLSTTVGAPSGHYQMPVSQRSIVPVKMELASVAMDWDSESSWSLILPKLSYIGVLEAVKQLPPNAKTWLGKSLDEWESKYKDLYQEIPNRNEQVRDLLLYS